MEIFETPGGSIFITFNHYGGWELEFSSAEDGGKLQRSGDSFRIIGWGVTIQGRMSYAGNVVSRDHVEFKAVNEEDALEYEGWFAPETAQPTPKEVDTPQWVPLSSRDIWDMVSWMSSLAIHGGGVPGLRGERYWSNKNAAEAEDAAYNSRLVFSKDKNVELCWEEEPPDTPEPIA